MTRSKKNYYEHIVDLLKTGHSAAVPKDALEKDGLTMETLDRHFVTKPGPFGLIHFLSIRKTVS